MICVAKGVTRTFARQVVGLATQYGARATVKVARVHGAEIWVRDVETDRDIVRQVILSLWGES